MYNLSLPISNKAARRESWKPQDIGQTERILEGVAPLLTMSAVDRIIDFASQTRRGSSVAFDYVHADALEGRVEAARKPFAYLTRLGSPIRSAIVPGEIRQFFQQKGFDLLSNFDHRALRQNYLVGSDGRIHGHLAEFVDIAHARRA
jgi:O-methyltransferase involved in polyketide biosynthesis